MALVSRLWPFLNPLTLKDFDVSWWAYYVRGARAYNDARTEASRPQGGIAHVR